MKHLIMWSISLAFVFVFPGWKDSHGAEPIQVFVSVLPQKYFVEKIGSHLVNVSVMVLPGANPHSYEPKPDQMRAISKAMVYFTIGVPFETVWLGRIASSNKKMLIVHTDTGIQKIPMKAHHQHEPVARGTGDPPKPPETGRSHAPDPHVWTSPPEVKVIAANIRKALEEIDPVNAAFYRTNYEEFLKEINSIDSELKEIFQGKSGLGFMVYHPAWGYLARTYGLEEIPIELEGKEPKPAQLKGLIQEARRRNVRVIFVQPQFSKKSAETIAKAIDGEVVSADPLHPDWAANLREQAGRFRKALR